MGIKRVANNLVREAVFAYSVRNRRAKARRISRWMDSQEVRTVLMVGATGRSTTLRNLGIVEDAVMAGRDVIMGINLEPQDVPYPFRIADARDMPFPEGFVDFALSNAVIEHVGDEDDQRRFVEEHTRVARAWAITTPNKWFPIEPHTAVLFVHWFPWWRRERPEFTRLLSLREFRRLLPEGACITGRPWSATFTATFVRDD